MKLNILGTEYQIITSDYAIGSYFDKRSASGFCDSQTHTIGICNIATYPGFEHEPPEHCAVYQKEVLRHEIIHAFLAESGLDDSALTLECSWARNEEMVDWFAIQGAKIYRAWQAAGAL